VPNQSVSLRLTKVGETEPEMIYAKTAGNKWRSPGEGWLGPQAGVWNQRPDGLHLMDPDNKLELAFCRGLVFDTCFTLESGHSNYRYSHHMGEWEILAVF